MPGDLKLSQIGYSPLPPPFREFHSPGIRKHCQIIFACYFRKLSVRKKKTKKNKTWEEFLCNLTTIINYLWYSLLKLLKEQVAMTES